MSNSDQLRKTHTIFGGGKNISTIESKHHEHQIKDIIPKVLQDLQKKYPELDIRWQPKITKKEIVDVLKIKHYKSENPNSFIKPDGGMIYLFYKNKVFPILIAEAKKQGTNKKRIKEGKPPQGMGNAIERGYKNFCELRIFCRDLSYFPYVIFAYGCDFAPGSSINDRLDALTEYQPRNKSYLTHPDKLATFYVQEPAFSLSEIYDVLFSTAENAIKIVTTPKKEEKGKNFSANNYKGKRKKSDFYETPYSLTRHLLKKEDFDKNLTVCEPACGGGAISQILSEKWSEEKITSYDIEKNFFSDMESYDYIITNPPFSLAYEFINQAKKLARKKFAFLLPLSYLHGKARFDHVYQDKDYGLKKIYVFTRYPMLGDPLRKDGKYRTGMMVYAWYIFENGFNDSPTIDWIDNNDDVIGKNDAE